ncbi:MAG: hypothetical protein WC333_05975 [Dehalococcoidia bacterium]
MQLSKFIAVTEDLEKRQGFGEGSFTEARANLGDDFLLKPLSLYGMTTYYYHFLSDWHSYRHEIDWQRLVASWGTAQQKIAAGLVNSNLENASDSELSNAAGLFNHLRRNSVAGMGITNISKLLALGLPSICMMWDQRIMKDFKRMYPPRPSSKSNTYHQFLLHQRSELQNLISQVQATNNQTKHQAIIWLMELPKRANCQNKAKPLAKLLDEYYWSQL